MREPVATRWARAQSTMARASGTTPAPAGERSVLAVVLPAFFVDGLGHTADEAVGHPVLAAVGDDPAQLGFEVRRAVAGRAPVEVDADLFAPLHRELAVEIVVQLVHRLLAVDGHPEEAFGAHWPAFGVLTLAHVLAHSLDPPGTLPTRPRASATSCNAFWRALLPRWILLITVPMGTSVISAISL